MKRQAFFAYSLLCYLLFLGVYAYMAGFVGSFLGIVPKSIDRPIDPTTPFIYALTTNLFLLIAFGAQHSIMARPGFKEVWTRWVPRPIERSTYVLASNIVLEPVSKPSKDNHQACGLNEP